MLVFPGPVEHCVRDKLLRKRNLWERREQRMEVPMLGSRPVAPDAEEDKTYFPSSIPGPMNFSLRPKAKDLQVMSK